MGKWAETIQDMGNPNKTNARVLRGFKEFAIYVLLGFRNFKVVGGGWRFRDKFGRSYPETTHRLTGNYVPRMGHVSTYFEIPEDTAGAGRDTSIALADCVNW